jgi:TctA family transporter
MSQGSLLIFVARPISAVITLAALFFFVLPLITAFRRHLRRSSVPAAAG